MHQIEKFSEEHIRRTKSEADKQQAADQKNSEGKVGRLNGELLTLNTQLHNNVQEHRDSESELRKVKTFFDSYPICLKVSTSQMACECEVTEF